MSKETQFQDFKKEVEKLREIDGADEYAKQLAHLFLGNGLSLQTILLMAIEFGQQHPAWVSVEVKMPEENTAPLVRMDLTEKFGEETILYDVVAFDGNGFHTPYRVTHWKQIVPPVKKEGEQ